MSLRSEKPKILKVEGRGPTREEKLHHMEGMMGERASKARGEAVMVLLKKRAELGPMSFSLGSKQI